MQRTRPGLTRAPRRSFPRSIVAVIAMYLLVDTLVTDRSASHATDAFAAQATAESDPVRLVLAKAPAIHVRIDGEPDYRDVAGTSLARIINTGFLILRDGVSKHYLRISDGWMVAPSLHGPWTVAASVPSECERVATDERIADLLMGGGSHHSLLPSPRNGPTPHIYIETQSADPHPRPRA